MRQLARFVLHHTPGFRWVNRRLQRHYTGCPHPEFALRGSFLSPLPDLKDVAARANSLFDRDVDLGPSIRLRANEQAELLRQWSRFYPEFSWPEQPGPDRRYYLNNPYFCHGDALSLYCMFRHFRPRQVVEVGSGFSSALMLDVDERFLGSKTQFTFIEPFPERLNALLRPQDRARVKIIEECVQKVSPSQFEALNQDDVLFIDSSHVAKVGSDVNYLFFEVLPRLKPGVLVHIHDIIWPFEYLQEWIMEGRAWNEAYLVRAFLQYNEVFPILFFNSYMGHHFRELVNQLMPAFLVNTGGSLWLQKAKEQWL